MTVYAYCDGAVKGNGKCGRIGMGAAILVYGLEDDSGKPHYCHWGMDCDPATNNLAELLAIRNTLIVVPSLYGMQPDDLYLNVFTDSEWAVKAITGEYKISCHRGLVDDILQLANPYDIFRIDWVRGHKGHLYNEIANELAQTEAGTWKGKH